MGKAQRISQEEAISGGFQFCSWDLETTGLNASFGHILCCTIKPFNQPEKTLRIDQYQSYKKQPWDDSPLVADIKQELERFHVAVSYNGFNFDIPFLNSRCISNRLRVLSPTVKHIDLINVTRRRMRLSSNSLDSLLAHIQSHTRKTPLDPEVWRKAVGGDKQSLDYIVEHNINDVIALEEAFNRLIPFLDIQFRLVK